MNAKTYDKKTAAFAGFLIQNIPADLDEETMDGWMNNPAATKTFLAGLKPMETSAEMSPLLSVLATTNLNATKGKKTKKCFPSPRYVYRDSPRYVYRDSDFDNWLPANQPDAGSCVISTLSVSREWTFAEAAATVLGLRAEMFATKTLGELLIQHGHTMTLVQAEEMVEATERGDTTGMRTDGWGNFFFVETGNDNDPVSVGRVRRGDRGWGARVDGLGRGDRWYAGNRLLVRNLDTSKI